MLLNYHQQNENFEVLPSLSGVVTFKAWVLDLAYLD